MKKFFGYLIIFLIFASIFVGMVIIGGWLATILTWVITIIICGGIAIGVWMSTED
jgi:hypothetical protein